MIKRQLFFDSSTNLLYIAIGNNGQLIEHTIRIGKQDHSKHIVDRINELLKRRDLTINHIDKIYVGKGPGSYTGIRSSVMVAKMLAYSKNIELYEISSLFFLSSGYPGLKAPMIDARNGNVFSAIYSDDEALLQDDLRNTESLKEIALNYHAQPILLHDFHYEVDLMKIMNMAKKVKDIHGFIPNYARKTQAERDNDTKSE